MEGPIKLLNTPSHDVSLKLGNSSGLFVANHPDQHRRSWRSFWCITFHIRKLQWNSTRNMSHPHTTIHQALLTTSPLTKPTLMSACSDNDSDQGEACTLGESACRISMWVRWAEPYPRSALHSVYSFLLLYVSPVETLLGTLSHVWINNWDCRRGS